MRTRELAGAAVLDAVLLALLGGLLLALLPGAQSEKGVRLAQKTQVGPRIPVGMQL